MLTPFTEIWLCDFEFTQPAGEHPSPICMVASEYLSGRLLRLWREDLRSRPEPPFSVGPETLFVAYYASAELGCFKALGWPMPARVLDLYPEFRCLTSGLPTPCGSGLLGALSYFGLDALDSVEKDSMRALAMRGGEYSAEEQRALLDYCESDVKSLAALLPKMLPTLDLPHALVRGRYMRAAAQMEWVGMPIDTETLTRLRANWATIQSRLIEEIDRTYGVYEGRSFRQDRWAAWLAANGIPWPRLPSGSLALDDDTFKEMARTYPAVAPVRELRASMSKLHLNELAVGADGRNRCLLSAFRSRTGRNQPSNSQFVFGTAAWLRGLVKPAEGWAMAYCDWSQQEFGIAAALSGDQQMQHAYLTGDPYLAFAVQAGAAPPDATKSSHPAVREQFKGCALAVQYSMGAEGLARKLDECPARGRELLRLHRDTYRRYWEWSDAIRDYAMLHGSLHTVFGWMVHVGQEVNPRSLRNFPLQANGAEMLRIACCLATERGIRVCAPVHDALLVEGPTAEIDEVVAETQRAMREASEIILSGFSLRSDATVVRFPHRYMDKRGEVMWSTVQRLLGAADGR